MNLALPDSNCILAFNDPWHDSSFCFYGDNQVVHIESERVYTAQVRSCPTSFWSFANGVPPIGSKISGASCSKNLRMQLPAL